MTMGWKLMVSSLTILSSSLILLIKSTTASLSSSSSLSLDNLERCGGRLERALEALQRDLPRRNRLDEEEAGIVYREKLESAPLEMRVSRIAIKLPRDSRNGASLWARVERCAYEPKTNALRTRVVFNDLSVSGVTSLLPIDYRAPATPAESCRMSLRLRRTGIDFYTSPIARGRGQMRIRTESSFFEPRFASIYAFGCRPTSRIDKNIERYDNGPSQQTRPDQALDAPEPRETAEARLDADSGPPRKNLWVTKIPPRREAPVSNSSDVGPAVPERATDAAKRVKKILDYEVKVENWNESTSLELRRLDDTNWQSRQALANEMEDIFLRGASQALARYIERQLHPAIKETLMLSMGYTISYG